MALAAAGALSIGVDALSALFSPAAKKKTGFNAASAFNVSGATTSPAKGSASPASSKLSPTTFNALLETQGQTQTSAAGAATTADRPSLLNKLFSALDGNGDGQIGKSEFQQQLGAGGTNTANADRVFGKLDTNGDGSLSIDELSAVLRADKKRRPHAPGPGNEQDPLLKALNDSDSNKAKLAKTASESASISAASSYNFVERTQQARLNTVVKVIA